MAKLRILSLNIEHGGVLMDTLVPFLCQNNADVMLLQEVHSSADRTLEPRLRTMQHFSNVLDYDFSSFTPQYRDYDTSDGRSYSGTAVFSRFPIVETKALYFDRPYTEAYRDSFETAPLHPSMLQIVRVLVEGKEVSLHNVHGPWNLVGEEYDERRKAMSDALIRETKGKERVVVAGDTNAKPTNEAFTRLNHLANVFGDELQTTFNLARKTLPGYATAAVDMMFVSPDVSVLCKECPRIEVSDHLPLVVEVDITD